MQKTESNSLCKSRSVQLPSFQSYQIEKNQSEYVMGEGIFAFPRTNKSEAILFGL